MNNKDKGIVKKTNQDINMRAHDSKKGEIRVQMRYSKKKKNAATRRNER
jgi:hypothetical protein